MDQDTNKLYILAVDNQGVSFCTINTIDLFESGISIVSYYVMCGDKVLDRVEL